MGELTLNKLSNSFEANGVHTPVDVLDPQELVHYRTQMVRFLDSIDWRLNAVSRHKPHLYLKWANELGRHPRILEAVTSILGPDVLMWYSVVFVKPAHNDGIVPWHQDATFWALEKDQGVTAWLALSDVDLENGCVTYIPGSHRGGDHPHSIENSETNILARGQLIRGFETDHAQPIELRAGQCSLHDPRVLHSSAANQSDRPRLGIAFRYIAADNAPKTLRWLKRSASLVSGRSAHARFAADPVPAHDYQPSCMKFHRQSVRIAAIHTLFGDTSRSWARKIADVLPILLTKKLSDFFGLSAYRLSKTMTAKTVLITGASSGIGREFAYALAPRAETLILCGRDRVALQATQTGALEKNPQLTVHIMPGNLTEPETRANLIRLVGTTGLDALVLNAGGGYFKRFLESNNLEDDDTISLNVRAIIHLCRELVPILLKTSGRSSLIFISSHAAFLHTPRFSVYAACKSFINHFALTLVQELRGQPIDILLVNPGATQSQFSERAGLPRKMISEPMSAATVVDRSLRALGRKHFLIVSHFDRLLYVASRLLPVWFFDAAVCRLQKKMLEGSPS